MSVTIQKVVEFNGDLDQIPEGTDRYTWTATWTSGGSGWVTATEASSDIWQFEVEDWTTGASGATRAVTYEVNHWQASAYPNDPGLSKQFTITQHADANGTINVTTLAPTPTTQAPTTQAPTPTTQTPLPLYTASNINVNVANGVEGANAVMTWSNNGTIVSFTPTVLGEGSNTYTLVVTVPSGYSNAGQQVSDTDTAVGEELYKITYNPNGGTLGSGSTGIPDQTGTHPLSVAANTAYVRDGYTFDSWNTSQYTTGTNYSAGAVPPTSVYTGSEGIYDKLTLWAKWNVVATTTQTPATTQAPPLCQSYVVTSFYQNECNVIQWRDCDGTVQMSSPIGTQNNNCPYGTPSLTICHQVDYDSFPNGPVWVSGAGGLNYNGTCS